MKQILSIICAACTMAALAGCNGPRPSSNVPVEVESTGTPAVSQSEPNASGAQKGLVDSPEDEAEGTVDIVSPDHQEDYLVETDYGSFIVPSGWFEYDEWSRPGKTYFVEAWELGNSYSSISVEYGKNYYAAEDHQIFARAILQQLGEGSGGGSYTEAGDVLYVFEVEDEEAKTIQYYVVGDYCFVLIHVTHWLNEAMPTIEDAAYEMAQSFVWA